MKKLFLIYIGAAVVCTGCGAGGSDDSAQHPLGDTPNTPHSRVAESAELLLIGGRGSSDAEGHAPADSGDEGGERAGAERPGDAGGPGDTASSADSADDSRRGGCRESCAPFTLATGPRFPVALAASATHLYWTTSGNEGAVLRVALAGGAPEVLASNQIWPSAIVVDASSVYWALGDKIMKMPVTGGTQSELVDESGNSVVALAIHADDLYFAVSDFADYAAVMKVPRTGGSTTLLTTDPGGHAHGIAVDDKWVYWANAAHTSNRLVQKVSIHGGEAVTLVSGEHLGFGFALRGRRLYYTTFDTTEAGDSKAVVLSVSIKGGTPTTLATGTGQPMEIAVDNTRVYWTAASTEYTFGVPPNDDGSVTSVPFGGGSTEPIAKSERDPSGLVSVGRRVCWANYGDGTIRCRARCNRTCE